METENLRPCLSGELNCEEIIFSYFFVGKACCIFFEEDVYSL